MPQSISETYGLGQLDNRNTAGTVEIQACGVSSVGVVVYNKYSN